MERDPLHGSDQPTHPTIRSIFPTFDVDVPMPRDTAVPARSAEGTQPTKTASSPDKGGAGK